MQADGPEAEVPQQQGEALGVVARGHEHQDALPRELVQHEGQVAVLRQEGTEGEDRLCRTGARRIYDPRSSYRQADMRFPRKAPCDVGMRVKIAWHDGRTLYLAGMKQYCWMSVLGVENLDDTSTYTHRDTSGHRSASAAGEGEDHGRWRDVIYVDTHFAICQVCHGGSP